VNFTTPRPSFGTANASRKDLDNHFLTGVGLWQINYDVVDDFHLQVSGVANTWPSDTASAQGRGWIKDIPSGASINHVLWATYPSGTSGTTATDPVLVIAGLAVNLYFGEGSSQPIEAETLAGATATSNDQANGVGLSQSSMTQPLKVIVNVMTDIG